jgi:purine nucleosidase
VKKNLVKTTNKTTINVFLDTDLGNNIDDTLALVYLIMHRNVNLTGIITSSGKGGARAKAIQMIGEELCVKIPIFVGAERNMVGKVMQKKPDLLDFHDADFGSKPSKDYSEVAAIMDAHSDKGINYLAIGPMTNIAHMCEQYPDICGKLEQLIWLGGNYSEIPDKPETNARLDPQAAAQMSRVNSFHQIYLGYEQTRDVHIDFDQLMSVPVFRNSEFLGKMVQQYYNKHQKISCNDVLAAVCLTHPAFFKYQQHNLNVELCQIQQLGQTRIKDSKIKPATSTHIISHIDTKNAIAHFFKTINGKSS